MKGVPPTSLPKSRMTVAGELVAEVVSTAEPVPEPARPAALVTVPLVRVTATARTLSLVGAGTRLCQFGLAGQVGSAAAAGRGSAAMPSRNAVTPMSALRVARLARRGWRIGLLLGGGGSGDGARPRRTAGAAVHRQERSVTQDGDAVAAARQGQLGVSVGDGGVHGAAVDEDFAVLVRGDR